MILPWYRVMLLGTELCYLVQSYATWYRVMLLGTELCYMVQSYATWYRVILFASLEQDENHTGHSSVLLIPLFMFVLSFQNQLSAESMGSTGDMMDEPPIMTQEEILLCYWKISVSPR